MDYDETSKRFALHLGFVPTRHCDPHPYWLMGYFGKEGPRCAVQFH
jgi:hypothetical protein